MHHHSTVLMLFSQGFCMISSFVYWMAPVYLVTSTFFRRQSVIAAPLIISHIVQLSPDPPYLYKSWLQGMIELIKENNNCLNCNKLPLLATLILVVALFRVLGAHRPANNSTTSKFFFLCGWLAGCLDNSTVFIKDILCLCPREWGALVGETV